MNRCLTEGRRAFLDSVAGIEEGSECGRLAPLLSALADGEASAAELRSLRPHLKTCLTCRLRLREFRAAPSRVAALVPPAVLAAGSASGPLRGFLESLLGAAQHKAAALGERAHTAAELATGQKVAAVAASAAALAGGGAGVSELASRPDPPRVPPPLHAKPVAGNGSARDERPAPGPVRVGSPPPAPKTAPPAAPAPPPRPPPATPPAPSPAPRPPPPPPDQANEFTPAPAPAPTPPSKTFAPSDDGGGSGSSAGGSEFGP